MCAYLTSSLLPILMIFPWLHSVSCSATNNTRLLADLLRDYQKSSRPGYNYSLPTVVNVEFDLLAIREFVELTNRFAISGVFELSWTDERMSWNPDNYGGIQEIYIPQDLAWKPELINTKPFSAVKAIGIPTFGIIYHFSGVASWTPGDNYDTPCEADVTYYPFDSQICTLRFSDWTQIPGTTKFVPSTSELGLGLYIINPTWDISRTTLMIDNDEFGHFVYFDIYFQRLHGFYVLNLILPICFISLVNIFVFVLPAESGERIGFSITVFLTLSVLLTILSEHLPKASRPRIPIVCYLIFFQTTISIFILLATIVSLRFFFTPDYVEVPRVWQRFVQILSLQSACRRTKRQISHTEVETKQTSKEMLAMNFEDIEESNDKKNNRKETRQQAFTERQTADTSEKVTWIQVGLAFDKICMFGFFLLNIINIATFFLIMYANGKL